MSINLGDKVRDEVSGLEGTVVLRIEHLNGCIQYGVQPKLKKDEKEITTWNIDEVNLEVIKTKAVRVKKKDAGGTTYKFSVKKPI